jgi:hypothetical protein
MTTAAVKSVISIAKFLPQKAAQLPQDILTKTDTAQQAFTDQVKKFKTYAIQNGSSTKAKISLPQGSPSRIQSGSNSSPKEESGLNFYGKPTNPVTFVDPSGLNPSVYDSPLFEEYRRGYPNNYGNYNCHGHAVGRSIPSETEEAFVRKHQVTPNSSNTPRWNTYPYNELQQNYVNVAPPFKSGDTLLYGVDVNGNGSIFEDIYYIDGKAVDEIKHSSVITEVDANGMPTQCESRMGQEKLRYHPPNDPDILRQYGSPSHVFRPKDGVNPNRVYRSDRHFKGIR